MLTSAKRPPVMNYEEYSQLFTKTAKEEGKNQAYIDACLNYAHDLYAHGVPIIYDVKHLSLLVGIKDSYIRRAVTYTDKYYWEFKVKKANGKERTIHEPLPTLKQIQTWILKHILETQDVHPFAKAYLHNKKLKDNARYHTRKKVVLTLDVHDFFPSIKMNAVADIFMRMGYAKKFSFLLAKLCCLDKCLPQGAPTSPYLSNLYLYNFDKKVSEYCHERKILYTRYADDLTFSSKEEMSTDELIKYVKEELSALSLTLNEGKTKIMRPSDAQIVTGIVVNERMRLPKKKRMELRQEMYYVITKGIENHLEKINCKKRNYLQHLIGKINFALYLEPSNPEFQDYRTYLLRLVDKNFKRKKKHLVSESGEELSEQEVTKVPIALVNAVRNNDNICHVEGLQLNYEPKNPLRNSLLYASLIRKLYKDYDVRVVEGIVVMTNGYSYKHHWCRIISEDTYWCHDITLDCFATKFSQAKERRYYPLKEYNIDEVMQLVIPSTDSRKDLQMSSDD